jgi:hypothetical protein
VRPLWSPHGLSGGVRDRGERDGAAVVGGSLAARDDDAGRGGPQDGRCYVQAAQDVGLVGEDGPGRFGDELLGAVVGAVRPDRPRGAGVARESLVGLWVPETL